MKLFYTTITPIKIAGFYSSYLISYLVDTLNMPLSQIKYKFIANKALKPDTFTEFFRYISDNFFQRAKLKK